MGTSLSSFPHQATCRQLVCAAPCRGAVGLTSGTRVWDRGWAGGNGMREQACEWGAGIGSQLCPFCARDLGRANDVEPWLPRLCKGVIQAPPKPLAAQR